MYWLIDTKKEIYMISKKGLVDVENDAQMV